MFRFVVLAIGLMVCLHDSCLRTPRASIRSLYLRRLSRLQICVVDCLSRCTVSINVNNVQN